MSEEKHNKKNKKEGKKDASFNDKSKQLGIEVTKTEDFATWYTQTIIKAEMIEYYDISGCYILRPWSFSIWEAIKEFFDAEIKKLGVQNAYFPLFVSEKALCTEKDHLEGFAPEVAWVTKSGKSDLAEPIAVRPTSETIMYPAYSKWIRSHRDLPLKLNQWTNVVRWEFKNPVPFLRTREFLWQEGHTAFATQQEAEEEVLTILDLYRRVYEDLLAVPVIKGRKSEKEKFAGAFFTTTVEAYIPGVGRGIQGATSHCLGQNFAKMFHIEFEDDENLKEGEKKKRKFVWQNSWGLTTRTIGIMTMVHGDDKGLVLPPRVAPIQIVIVPIFFGEAEILQAKSHEIAAELKKQGFRVTVDDRTNYNPGWKYNHWELKGVPLRVELGPKDLQNDQVVIVRRDNGVKEAVKLANLTTRVPQLLNDVHNYLFTKASEVRDARCVKVRNWDDFITQLHKGSMILTPWCQQTSCEDNVKIRSSAKDEKAEQSNSNEQESTELTGSAKTLCLPLNQDPLEKDAVCFSCGAPASRWALWGRSY